MLLQLWISILGGHRLKNGIEWRKRVNGICRLERPMISGKTTHIELFYSMTFVLFCTLSPPTSFVNYLMLSSHFVVPIFHLPNSQVMTHKRGMPGYTTISIAKDSGLPA